LALIWRFKASRSSSFDTFSSVCQILFSKLSIVIYSLTITTGSFYSSITSGSLDGSFKGSFFCLFFGLFSVLITSCNGFSIGSSFLTILASFVYSFGLLCALDFAGIGSGAYFSGLVSSAFFI
jgi:hypothetical protein